MNKTNKGLIALLVITGEVYIAYKQSFKDKKLKQIGNSCNNFGGGPDGIVVYDFPLAGAGQTNMVAELACKRCNETGCRQLTL
jgi:hypothetical protein